MSPALDPQARERLSDAAAFRLMAILFSRPRPGLAAEAAALAGETGDPELARAARAFGEAREGPYFALLGPGGAAPAREAAYLGLGDPGRTLAELATRYQAFGFFPGEEEPHDHVAVECDYLSFMNLKEAYALSRGEAEAALLVREERERFGAEHLSALGHGLAARLPADAPAHLAAAARALARRLPAPPPEPAFNVLAEEEEDPLAQGCPMVGEA